MSQKKYGLDIVIPQTDTKVGPGLEYLQDKLDEDTDPLAAYNDDHKHE